MYEAVFMAATGLTNQQRRLDVIADNLANVNSVGHRANRIDFADALYTAGLNPSYPRTPEPDGNQRHGHGVITASITRETRQGALQQTGQELDLALEGRGYLSVADNEGNVFYKRGGSYYISIEDDAARVVDAEGYYLQDEDGYALELPEGTSNITVTEDGSLAFVDGNGEVLETHKLGIYEFTNELGLDSDGGDRYVETEISGDMWVSERTKVHQGNLEMSNVDLAKEMTNMIRAQRAFQLASRALTTADDMEGLANTVRK
ncbi:MAG: flagellar hook-basal body protein [Oscillospiraceae bacterium]|jgi:flagellar basal-body rod protein FlgG|nr:flagellar hook-basal body protein [Oscillospiraceae bacterium]